MAYCTAQDMIDRFGEDEVIQLTDRARQGIIDDGVLDRALSDAQAEVDGYLAARYPLPLASVPPVLVRVSADITRYYLFDRAATDQVESRYKAAVALLRDISAGRVTLGLPEAATPQTSNTVTMESGGRVFERSAR